jgi:uncharacterized RDD family membrane protein YckC
MIRNLQDELIGNKGKPRIFAMVFDNLIASLVSMFVAGKTPGLSDTARVVLLCVVYLSYFFIPEALSGRTLGKLLTGLVVVRTDGSPDV